MAVVRARRPEETVSDGEVVVLDETGRPLFGALQRGSRSRVIVGGIQGCERCNG